MPAIAQILTSCVACKGQPSSSGDLKKKATWFRFGEDLLSATEEAVSDLVKVLNPTIHEALLKKSDSKEILNSLKVHKGDPPIELIQRSIQTAIQVAVQSAVQEAIRIRNSESCSSCQDKLEPLTEEVQPSVVAEEPHTPSEEPKVQPL